MCLFNAGRGDRNTSGDKKTITLVDIAGNQVVKGGNNLTAGAATEERKAAVRPLGFLLHAARPPRTYRHTTTPQHRAKERTAQWQGQ